MEENISRRGFFLKAGDFVFRRALPLLGGVAFAQLLSAKQIEQKTGLSDEINNAGEILAWTEGYSPGWPREVSPERVGYVPPKMLQSLFNSFTSEHIREIFPSCFACVKYNFGIQPYPPGTVVGILGMPWLELGKPKRTIEIAVTGEEKEKQAGYEKSIDKIIKKADPRWVSFTQKAEGALDFRHQVGVVPIKSGLAGTTDYGDEVSAFVWPRCLDAIPIRNLPEGIRTDTLVVEGRLEKTPLANGRLLLDWQDRDGSLGILGLTKDEVGSQWRWKLTHVFNSNESEALRKALPYTLGYFERVMIGDDRFVLYDRDNVAIRPIPIAKEGFPSGLLVERKENGESEILSVFLREAPDGVWYDFIPLTRVNPGGEILPKSDLNIFPTFEEKVVSVSISGDKMRVTTLGPNDLTNYDLTQTVGARLADFSQEAVLYIDQPVKKILLAWEDETTYTTAMECSFGNSR